MSLSSILCSYKGGWTALGLAAYRGHLEVVTLLVGAGASIDIQDNVSTRIRLYIQRNYNPYVHHNKIIKIIKLYISMHIQYLMKKINLVLKKLKITKYYFV